jgi:hypothetical protein
MTLFPTLILAFIIIAIAIALLAISWIVTGKSTIRGGSCGRDPSKKKDSDECGTDVSCSLCHKPEDDRKQ